MSATGDVHCLRPGCFKGWIYWRNSGLAGELVQPAYLDKKGQRDCWHSVRVPCSCSGLPTPINVPETDPLPANCWVYPCFLNGAPFTP